MFQDFTVMPILLLWFILCLFVSAKKEVNCIIFKKKKKEKKEEQKNSDAPQKT